MLWHNRDFCVAWTRRLNGCRVIAFQFCNLHFSICILQLYTVTVSFFPAYRP